MESVLMRAAILWLCLSSIALGQAEAVIDGPSESAPGDLIILSADKSICDDLAWQLVNSSKAFLPVEDGRKVVFASGDAGRYVFVLAVSKATADGSQVAIATHEITIGEPEPPKPPPKPPKPEPPKPDLPELGQEAYRRVLQIDATSEEMDTLAKNVDTARNESTLSAIQTKLRDLNRESVFATDEARNRWLSFAEWFAAQGKSWKTADQARDSLLDISGGLVAASKVPKRSLLPPLRKSGTLRDAVDGLKTDVQQIRAEVGP